MQSGLDKDFWINYENNSLRPALIAFDIDDCRENLLNVVCIENV